MRYGGATGLGIAGGVLLGCGEDEPSDDGAATGPLGSAPSGSATANANLGRAQSGGTWFDAREVEPTNIDNQIEPSSNVTTATVPVYSKLVRWKTGPGVVPASVLEGDSAESWESPDPTTWTFHLRDDCVFHPKPPLDGRPIDSEDVRSSVERHLAVSPARQTLENLIDTVETPDESTITFRLTQDYAPFANILSGPLLVYVFSKEANAGEIDTQRIEGAIGSGPWMWERRESSVALEWARHPNWHIRSPAGDQVPYMERWRQLVIPEYAQRLAQFAAGRILSFTPAVEDASGLQSRAPSAQVFAEPVPQGHSFFIFDQANADNAMRDTRLRRAWSMALDRQTLLDVFGQVEKASELGYELDTGISNPPIPYGVGMEYWYLDPYGLDMGPSSRWFEYDPSEATKLVEASSYDGHEIKIDNPGGDWIPTLEAQIPMLRDVGFNPSINVQEYSQFVGGAYSGNGPYQAGWTNVTAFPTADEWCYNLFMPNAIRNMNALSEETPNAPEVFKLIEQQRRELDPEARQEIIHEIQRRCADEMWYVPSIKDRWGRVSFVNEAVRGYGDYDGGPSNWASETLPFYSLEG